MNKGGWVYIMTNRHHTTLYIGVTNNLMRRVQEHQTKFNPKSFTAQYNVCVLVYYEFLPTIMEAILREKQLKRWSRAKKEWLIEMENPDWDDLSTHSTSSG
jgi:putative endonuclease